MKRGTRRGDGLPTVAPALNWRAPQPQGGGGAAEAATAEEQLQAAVRHVDALLFLAAELSISSPAVREALAWRRGAGEPVKVGGLAAEGFEAGCAGCVAVDARRSPGAEAHSSGLAAEGDEAAAAASTTPTDAEGGATSGEPGGARFGAMLQQLGGRPA